MNMDEPSLRPNCEAPSAIECAIECAHWRAPAWSAVSRCMHRVRPVLLCSVGMDAVINFTKALEAVSKDGNY